MNLDFNFHFVLHIYIYFNLSSALKNVSIISIMHKLKECLTLDFMSLVLKM